MSSEHPEQFKTNDLKRMQDHADLSNDCVEILTRKTVLEINETVQIPPIWLEIFEGLYKAWKRSLLNNNDDQTVHSPQNSVALLQPWINRLINLNILTKPQEIDKLDSVIKGFKYFCAEVLNDYAVALSESKPSPITDLNTAIELIRLCLTLDDKPQYRINEALILKQLKSKLK